MTRDLWDYILDIRESLKEVKEFTHGIDLEDFLKDKKTTNAVIRSLEVLGEAAKKIPEEMRQRYPEVPWRRMTGMRDKLIHEYHGVDLETIWSVVKTELPPLESHVEKIIKDLENQS